MTPTVNDEMEQLENAVKRRDAEDRAADAVSAARARLVIGKSGKSPAACAFFATLALKLKAVPRWDIDTAAVDGVHLYYNPDFWLGLSADEQVGVVCHEVLHCALKHLGAERLGFQPKKANVAQDCVLNPIVADAGLALPRFALFAGQRPSPEQGFPADWCDAIERMPRDLSWDAAYKMLPDWPEEQGPGAGGQGPGGDDPGGCGVGQAPGDGSEAARKQAEADWQVAVAQAHAVARRRGTLPGGLDKLVQATLAPTVNWRDVLREFVCRAAKNDHRWCPPNRRFLAAGLCLPSLQSEELGHVVIHIDTSGSTWNDLPAFAGEVQGILDCYDVELTIIYCDCEVKRVDHWTTSDGPLVLHAVGCGGTSHVPVFAYIEENGIQPTCLVSLTDLYTCLPEDPPDYPVLFAVVGNENPQAPWGQIVSVG